MSSAIRYSSYWTLQLGGWLAFSVLWYIASLPIYDDLGVTAELALVRVLIHSSMGLVLTEIFRPLYRTLWGRSSALVKIVFIASICSLAGSIMWGLAFEYIKWPIEGEPFDEKPLFQYLRSFVLTAFLLFAWSLLYFGIKANTKLQSETERALKAEALAQRARLDMLRYQLNPHFLFNALNSIRALIDENGAKAREMVTGLSDYLRFSLLDGQAVVSIREEVEVIQHYLDIEKIRFEDRLTVSFDISANVKSVRIPALLIHPLIENALKHGMHTSGDQLRVHLGIRPRGEDVIVRVENSGELIEPVSDQGGTGIGLQNVRARLQQAYPDTHTFEIYQQSHQVIAEIVLQSIRPASENP